MFNLLKQPQIPNLWSVIVVFPTELTPERARKAFKMGVADCVNKPYDEDGLLALIELMFAEHRITIAHEPSSPKEATSVLIVDDDTDWRTTLIDYLPPIKTIEQATDYSTALAIIEHQSFDCIVVDLRLIDAEEGNFDGMNLIRKIRIKDKERHAFTQILIVSAYGMPEHIREAFRDYNIFYYFDKRYLSLSKYRNVIMEALVV